MSAHIAGELANWPTKEHLAAILRNAGFGVVVGQYAIRIENCKHFSFEEFGGDLGDPSVDASADTVEEMMRDGRLVSGALARAGIRHRFEIYNDANELSGYLHHEWPLSKNISPDRTNRRA